MTVCNFSNHESDTLGIAEPIFGNVNFVFINELLGDTELLIDDLNRFLFKNYEINPLARWCDSLTCFALEMGCQEGFLFYVDSPDESDLEQIYKENLSEGEDCFCLYPVDMTYQDFLACHHNTLEFCTYVMRALAKCLPLTGQNGGAGGEYVLPDNSDEQHAKFKKVYEQLIAQLATNTHYKHFFQ